MLDQARDEATLQYLTGKVVVAYDIPEALASRLRESLKIIIQVRSGSCDFACRSRTFNRRIIALLRSTGNGCRWRALGRASLPLEHSPTPRCLRRYLASGTRGRAQVRGRDHERELWEAESGLR